MPDEFEFLSADAAATIELFLESVESSRRLRISDISERLDGYASKVDVATSIGKLQMHGLVDYGKDTKGNKFYSLSESGLKMCADLIRAHPEFILYSKEKRNSDKRTESTTASLEKQSQEPLNDQQNPPSTEQTSLSDSIFLPASDRFVTVRDNQEPFDRVEKSLDDIVAEYAKDRRKNNSFNSEEGLKLETTIKAVQAQINVGIVSLKLLRDDLVGQLGASQKFFSALPGIKLLIDEAIKAVRALLEFLG